MVQQPRDSVTYAQLRELLQNEPYKGELFILGQSSSGLEAAVKRPEGYHFYTVTDLSLGFIRKGQLSAVMGANVGSVQVDATVSPGLDGTLTDYGVQIGIRTPSAAAAYVFGLAWRLTTSTNLQIYVRRQLNSAQNTTIGPISTVTVWPSDVQADVGLGHQHATDSLGNTGYIPTLTTDPHLHSLLTGLTGTTYTLHWGIFRNPA